MQSSVTSATLWIVLLGDLAAHASTSTSPSHVGLRTWTREGRDNSVGAMFSYQAVSVPESEQGLVPEPTAHRRKCLKGRVCWESLREQQCVGADFASATLDLLPHGVRAQH